MTSTNQELNLIRKKVNKELERTGRRQDWVAKQIEIDKTVLNKLLRNKSKLNINTQCIWLNKIYKMLKPGFSKN